MPISDETPFRKGSRISRDSLNQAAGSRVKDIVAGPGILIRRLGGTYVIEATGGGPRSSGDSSPLHIATNYTALNALTNITDGHFGYTQDTDKHYLRQNGAWVEIVFVALTSTAPQSVGETNTVGNGTTAARHNHVHASDFRMNAGKGQYRSAPTTWVTFTHFS